MVTINYILGTQFLVLYRLDFKIIIVSTFDVTEQIRVPYHSRHNNNPMRSEYDSMKL